MSRTAIRTRQLAVGQTSHEPVANCLLPIASLDAAKTFTVTGQVTSVTHPGLAESVLIDVGKLDLGLGPRSFEPAGCGRCRSFRGGACIQ